MFSSHRKASKTNKQTNKQKQDTILPGPEDPAISVVCPLHKAWHHAFSRLTNFPCFQTSEKWNNLLRTSAVFNYFLQHHFVRFRHLIVHSYYTFLHSISIFHLMNTPQFLFITVGGYLNNFELLRIELV
jgi:hypothetical protein